MYVIYTYLWLGATPADSGFMSTTLLTYVHRRADAHEEAGGAHRAEDATDLLESCRATVPLRLNRFVRSVGGVLRRVRRCLRSFRPFCEAPAVPTSRVTIYGDRKMGHYSTIPNVSTRFAVRSYILVYLWSVSTTRTSIAVACLCAGRESTIGLLRQWGRSRKGDVHSDGARKRSSVTSTGSSSFRTPAVASPFANRTSPLKRDFQRVRWPGHTSTVICM